MTITKGNRNNWQFGVTFHRFNGRPSLVDPLGLTCGYSVGICLGFINIGFRRHHGSPTDRASLQTVV